jgi:hypothetical protein
MAAEASAPDRLREKSIGLPHALFQSITHMAPGAAIAFSILFSVQFAGPALPLSVVLALVACLLVASSIGQMALDNADRIFVEEEFVGPAGPYDVPPPTAPAEGRAG